MPENLTGWKIKVWAHGPRHQGRPGRGRGRHQEEPPRPPASAALLRAEGRGGPVGQRPQLPQEREGGARSPWNWKAAPWTLLGDASTRRSSIAAGGEKRVDWRVKVKAEGEAVVRMKAVTDEESDAMEMRFPCYVHGMLKMDSFSGVIRPDKDSGHGRPSLCPPSAASTRPGWKCATRRPWPGPWSTPCPTWSIIPTAAPSRRSTASCRRSSRSASCRT